MVTFKTHLYYLVYGFHLSTMATTQHDGKFRMETVRPNSSYTMTNIGNEAEHWSVIQHNTGLKVVLLAHVLGGLRDQTNVDEREWLATRLHWIYSRDHSPVCVCVYAPIQLYIALIYIASTCLLATSIFNTSSRNTETTTTKKFVPRVNGTYSHSIKSAIW